MAIAISGSPVAWSKYTKEDQEAWKGLARNSREAWKRLVQDVSDLAMRSGDYTDLKEKDAKGRGEGALSVLTDEQTIDKLKRYNVINLSEKVFHEIEELIDVFFDKRINDISSILFDHPIWVALQTTSRSWEPLCLNAIEQIKDFESRILENPGITAVCFLLPPGEEVFTRCLDWIEPENQIKQMNKIMLPVASLSTYREKIHPLSIKVTWILRWFYPALEEGLNLLEASLPASSAVESKAVRYIRTASPLVRLCSSYCITTEQGKGSLFFLLKQQLAHTETSVKMRLGLSPCRYSLPVSGRSVVNLLHKEKTWEEQFNEQTEERRLSGNRDREMTTQRQKVMSPSSQQSFKENGPADHYAGNRRANAPSAFPQLPPPWGDWDRAYRGGYSDVSNQIFLRSLVSPNGVTPEGRLVNTPFSRPLHNFP